MSDTHFTELSAAFDRLVQLPEAERAAALAQLSEPLRSEVARLLEADDGPADPVRAALDELGSAPLPTRSAGARLGPWRVLREIGAGGMGTVLLVERADGQYEQQAALKLIRGFPTEEGRRRLRQERQILAQLDHPCIARLLDGGETEDGQPWVAMEYVEGLDLIEHVARHGPDLRARLALFDRISEAVEHAHQRLVIHRDLKPANVMVRADGTPKLLDFGVAKLIDLGIDSARRHTSTRVWTPGYASPEQRHGRPVTTASDVYALGVMLDEMLRGDATAQAAGGFPALGVDAELRGVIEMARTDDPRQRYPTVEALREELRRYLEGRPLRAAADTRLYRLRKFVRRHRLPVLLSALAAVLLGVFVWRLGVERAEAIEARALAERAQVSRSRQFRFLATIFQGAAGRRADGSALLAVDLIDRARERLEEQLGEDRAARADVEQMLGSAYLNAGRYPEAKAMYLAASEHGRGVLPDGERAGFLREAARMAEQAGDYAETHALLDQAQALLGPPPYDSGEAQTAIRIRLTRILTLKAQKDPRQAEVVAEAAEVARAWLPAEHPLLALMLGEQAALSESAGDYSRLVEQRREVLGMFLRRADAYPTDIAVQRLNLSRALALTGELDAAEAELARAQTELDGAFADTDHGLRSWALMQGAGLLQARGHHAQALTQAQAAMAMNDRLGEPTPFADLMRAAEMAVAAGASGQARLWLEQAAAQASTEEGRARAAAALAALAQ
jgi:eukaryotic-like serine/threonine-protein kinase